MDLTPELKAVIDEKSHHELLAGIRCAPVGDLMFQGESGQYWMERRSAMQRANPTQAVADSKSLMR